MFRCPELLFHVTLEVRFSIAALIHSQLVYTLPFAGLDFLLLQPLLQQLQMSKAAKNTRLFSIPNIPD